MFSRRGEISLNTNAKTIGRKPTKSQQILTTKPRRRSRPSKFSKLVDFSQIPNTLPQNAAREKSRNAILFSGGDGEEERNDVNSLWNDGKSSYDGSYLDSFPDGYRFCPLDEELVVYYLKKKVKKEPLPPNRIHEINIYQYNPEYLAEKYKRPGEKEMYFFTPRIKKYPNGSRPNGAAGRGYWKASGAEKSINFKKEKVGFKRTLNFCIESSPKIEKTNWIMHEFTVHNPTRIKSGSNHMTDLQKNYKSVKSSKAHEDTNESVMNSECEYNVEVDSGGHALTQSEISETPHFSNNTPHSMANINELSQALDSYFCIGLEMLETLPLCTSGSSNYLTNEFSWNSISMELKDYIWSSFMPKNCSFDPELDFCNGSTQNSQPTGVPNDSFCYLP